MRPMQFARQYALPSSRMTRLQLMSHQQIHLADFDGDKKCDILLVDKNSGATTVILNKFSSGKFSWSNIGVVTGSASCTEGYGTDKHDKGVRWHDIDGDGRADFLCVTTDGVVSGYLNKGVNNMVNQGMIKHTEGKERRSELPWHLSSKVDFNEIFQIYASPT